MYLGFLGIGEAASKECGAITLDLLLRAGMLQGNEMMAGCWKMITNIIGYSYLEMQRL